MLSCLWLLILGINSLRPLMEFQAGLLEDWIEEAECH